MKREQSGTFLSAVFVDYDNIYLSLKRKSEEAAKRFAKDVPAWLKQIETSGLITPTNGPGIEGTRRIVMNRCYGNPVPRRNSGDNSTDMSSFPFVRHQFLRAGFEIIDCPPLTAQLKNSSDIRMVMDVRDCLTHPTYFDEFIILSGDADFTSVLHRLRAHARRTVIFATDYTAVPYTAISDGEVREADLIALLLEGRIGARARAAEVPSQAEPVLIEAARREILADVAAAVRSAATPVPLEVLADRAVRLVGHEKTIGTAWGGAGGFRELLAQGLAPNLKLSSEPPYVVIDTQRHLIAHSATETSHLMPSPASHGSAHPSARTELAEPQPERTIASAMARLPAGSAREPFGHRSGSPPPLTQSPIAAMGSAAASQSTPTGHYAPPSAAPPKLSSDVAMPAALPRRAPEPSQANFLPSPASAPPRASDLSSIIERSIARIQEACQAPPLAPPDYRMLFEVMVLEINDNGLIGAQTIQNIMQRALERGLDLRRDDVRFVLEVVSEADPWFEQGASANLFAGRFRNFVVARCRSQGLNLSADELDLVERWFAGNAAGSQVAPRQPAPQQPTNPLPARTGPAEPDPRSPQWPPDEGRQRGADQRPSAPAPRASAPGDAAGEDFPRIIRTRLRG